MLPAPTRRFTRLLHFDKGQTTPVNGFWSLTMYNDKQLFVENPLGRYAIGDRDKLKESNWLPASKGSFNLIMRMSWPKKPVLDGIWTPPAITHVK